MVQGSVRAMKTLLSLCSIVLLLSGGVLSCPGAPRPPGCSRPSSCFFAYPYAGDGAGFQSGGSPPINPDPLAGPLYGQPPVYGDYGGFPGQNFMRAQGGCIHSCGWGKKK